MAKLYFKYGAMGSSKSAQALIAKYNYEERGMKVWLIKPMTDTRDGANIIKSRIGLSAVHRFKRCAVFCRCVLFGADLNKNEGLFLFCYYITTPPTLHIAKTVLIKFLHHIPCYDSVFDVIYRCGNLFFNARGGFPQ